MSSDNELRMSMSAETLDAGLRRAVMASLVAEPRLTTRHIGVSVRGGVVTLSGYVTSYAQKDAASAAVRRAKGVDRVTDTLGVAVPCDGTGAGTGTGADPRRTLTLSGGPVPATRAGERALDGAHADGRS